MEKLWNQAVWSTQLQDFRVQQKPTELYANLRMHKTQAGAPDSTWSTEHAGMVEYSTLAIHQC
ncbi:hypothetical protein PAMP_011962 [Pampus punctatissimus]